MIESFEHLDAESPSNLRYWAVQLGVSEDMLKRVVRSVGTDIDKVKLQLISFEAHEPPPGKPHVSPHR